MCVLALAWNVEPRWLLMVAANRDERHDRAAAPLARWADADLIAGRDLAGGGTWLGVSEAGRFAAVTNRRDCGDRDPDRPSRGQLIHDLATGEAAIADIGPERYNPLNAVLIDRGHAMRLSNQPSAAVQPLPPGYHALSNGPLDASWRKTTRLTAAIRGWTAVDGAPVERLFAALRDLAPPTDADDDPAAIFVLDPVYGTRCSTIVLVERSGAGTIIERRYGQAGSSEGDTRIVFRWPTGA